MHKSFSFKGMGGSSDKLLAQDGECMELVNLREVGGSLRPVPQMVELATLDTLYSAIYWHEQASCYLCVTDDSTSTIHFYDSEWEPLIDSSGKRLVFSSLSGVKLVEFIGAVVCCMTAKAIVFLKSDSGTYKWLGERPEIPRLNISAESYLHQLVTDTEFRNGTAVGEEKSVWKINEKGYIDECIFNLEAKGYFIDRALFKFAIRLFDGSYIYCSQPFYVCDDNVIDEVGRDARNMLSEAVNDTVTSSKYKVKVKGFKPMLRFSSLDFANWKGVVTGIDVFTTGSLKGKKVETFNATFRDSEGKQSTNIKYEKYVAKGIGEIWNDVNDAYLYYKYAEYNLDGGLLSLLDDVSKANLALQEGLAAADVTPSLSSTGVGCSYVLNGRLHIGALREYFYKGYDAYSYVPASSFTKVIEGLVVEVKIKTLGGTSRVVKVFDMIELGYKDGLFEIQPLLTYPDSRAYEMNIFAVLDTEKFKKTFPLTPHKYLNVAQYLNKWYLNYEVQVEAFFESGVSAAYISTEDVLKLFSEQVGVHKVYYSEKEECWMYNGSPFPSKEFSGLRIFAVRRDQADGDMLKFTIAYGESELSFKDVRNIQIDSTWKAVSGQYPYYEEAVFEERPNVMKVSSVENPFFFPAKSVFSPSRKRILALCSNTFELSQGKFGEHPLFLFCNDGIWAMSVDASGTVAYSAAYPISKEVCCTPASVCNVNSGIVFVSNEGVMLLSGSTLEDISRQIVHDSENIGIMGRSSLLQEILSLAGLSGVSGGMQFLQFVKGGKVAYMCDTNEIIFGNNKASYSYVFSLNSGNWRKMDEKIKGFVCDSGSLKTYRHSGYETVIKEYGTSMSGSNRVVVITRPLQWGTKLAKRVTELMLHAYVSPETDGGSLSPFFGCYLLGSNDGANFKVLAGAERNKKVQDISLPYFPTSSYRYFVIAFAGYVDGDTVITGMELDIALAWSNRLDL